MFALQAANELLFTALGNGLEAVQKALLQGADPNCTREASVRPHALKPFVCLLHMVVCAAVHAIAPSSSQNAMLIHSSPQASLQWRQCCNICHQGTIAVCNWANCMVGGLMEPFDWPVQSRHAGVMQATYSTCNSVFH